MYFFDPRSSKNLEILNESIFLLICYHFVIFVNLLWDTDTRDKVGKSLVWTTSAILILNTGIILIVSTKDVKRRIYLYNLKKLQKAQYTIKEKRLEHVASKGFVLSENGAIASLPLVQRLKLERHALRDTEEKFRAIVEKYNDVQSDMPENNTRVISHNPKVNDVGLILEEDSRIEEASPGPLRMKKRPKM